MLSLSTDRALPALGDATLQQRRAAFWRMSREERLACYRRGELTFRECLAWAARRPDEPPRLNGEFEFIAALTPEVTETNQ